MQTHPYRKVTSRETTRHGLRQARLLCEPQKYPINGRAAAPETQSLAPHHSIIASAIETI
jgi:hypothetical protein